MTSGYFCPKRPRTSRKRGPHFFLDCSGERSLRAANFRRCRRAAVSGVAPLRENQGHVCCLRSLAQVRPTRLPAAAPFTRSRGSRSNCAAEALSENFAFKNPSFEVFSSSRLTRYDMPGSNSPTGAILADAITHLDQRALDRAGHSVEQLKLEAAADRFRVVRRRPAHARCCGRCANRKRP